MSSLHAMALCQLIQHGTLWDGFAFYYNWQSNGPKAGAQGRCAEAHSMHCRAMGARNRAQKES